LALDDGTSVSAKALVNAAGPWVADMVARAGVNSKASVRLIKGSHIIVPALFQGHHAYMLQQPDGRIVFAISYDYGSTLVGTTDEAVDTPEEARITEAEKIYLCASVNRYFKRQTDPTDIIGTFSGVRPLYDDGASEAKAVTRDYVLELDENGPPLLSVFGGKITTARHLAEEAIGRLGKAARWKTSPATRTEALPGGNLQQGFESFLKDVRTRWPFLGDDRSERMARAYGTMLMQMLADVRQLSDMGEDFGAGLTKVEVDWLVQHEWARDAEDILLRRTKIGLATGEKTVAALTRYINERA
jgi:glycerol-3-phosphate dehydrogenase